MINIIYFIWINQNRPYKEIIEGQLDDIIESDILSEGFLNIVISLDINIQSEITQIIDKKLININNKYAIDFHHDNKYEYYGIKKLYDLSKINPNNIYFYMHSKGMYTSYGCSGRTHHEKRLTRGHLNKYKIVKKQFIENDDVVSAGMFPGDLFYGNKNFIWFNFFYAKGSYLLNCEEPKTSNDNRFYYEFWLGSNNLENNSNIKIYNIIYDNYEKIQKPAELIGSNRFNEDGSLRN